MRKDVSAVADEDKRQPEEPAAQSPQKISAFQNAWEMQAKARREAEIKAREKQAAEEAEAYQAREEYAKELQEEKVDLIRLKQGVISESDKVFRGETSQKKYTLGEKIGNWLYHSKWWLGIAVFVVLIGAFLIYDYVTHDDPDIQILVTTQNADFYLHQDDLMQLIASVCPDFDGDGEQEASVIYIPVTKEMMESGSTYASSTNTQLLVQFQSAMSMLVIADDEANLYLKPEVESTEMFEDLSAMYPDCPFADGYKLRLEDTDLAEQLGMTEPLNAGTYLALRQVLENMESLEKNQAAYDKAKEVLDALVPLLNSGQKEAE